MVTYPHGDDDDDDDEQYKNEPWKLQTTVINICMKQYDLYKIYMYDLDYDAVKTKVKQSVK